MKEQILKEYFDGQIKAKDLNLDIEGSRIKTGLDTSETYIEPVETNEEYEVNVNDIIKLCDDSISGELSEMNLNTIAFALMGSDYFTWDESSKFGKRIANVIFELDNPGICYPINTENLELWKKYLTNGEHKLKK